MQTRILLGVALALLIAGAEHSSAQGTAFVYQGQLTQRGQPARGEHDLRFELFNAPTNGTALATQDAPDVRVNDGEFTVTLDFGANAFDGSDRWLQISVRERRGNDFITLAPRQQIMPVPYAIMANTASNLLGTVQASQLQGSIPAERLSGTIPPMSIGASSIDSTKLAIGSVSTAHLATNAVTLDKLALTPGGGVDLVATLTNSIGTATAIARFDDNRVIIGTALHPGDLRNVGAVYLYNLSGTLLATIPSPTSIADSLFGFSVAAVGADRLLVGAIGVNKAYLFTTNGIRIRTISSPSSSTVHNFGWSVAALGADKFLIGANDASKPAVYLYDLSGTLLKTITNTSLSSFGFSLAAVASDKILVGAPGKGEAYLYDSMGQLLTTFTNPEPGPYPTFGHSLAVAAPNRVIIGSIGTGNAAYMFDLNGTLITKFTNPNPADESFGTSITMLGSEKVVIGSPWDRSGGLAYVFSTNGIILHAIASPAKTATGFGFTGASIQNKFILGLRSYVPGDIAFIFTPGKYMKGLTSDGVLPGTILAASLADGAVTAPKLAFGSVDASKIKAATITSRELSPSLLNNTFWKLGGNVGTSTTTNFLGTTDNQPLELRVHNMRALRIEPRTNGAPNIIAGNWGNTVGTLVWTGKSTTVWTLFPTGMYGATISGGGAADQINVIASPFGTIGGGGGNMIANWRNYGTVGGGFSNQIRYSSFGPTNGAYTYATIAGGCSNVLYAAGGFIGGGIFNQLGTPQSEYFEQCSVISGGFRNKVGSYAGYSAIAGGCSNSMVAWYSSIAGGLYNYIGHYGTTRGNSIGGGIGNYIQNLGGFDGFQGASTISGGTSNRIEGSFSTIAGGLLNSAAGNLSLAAGRRAKADHHGAFVWADSTDYDFTSMVSNTFSIRATGGARFVSAIDTNGTPTAGVELPAGGGAWASLSDRDSKENFAPINPREVLARVDQIPIQTWKYKSQDNSVRHIGPTAQDFASAFQVGESDRRITTVDADGVALAAIQGLSQVVKEKDAKIQQLEERIARLEQLMNQPGTPR